MGVGVVCDVKRFAVHDGPGVRTTLFLKGCPLRCRWCHNPETFRPEPELGVRRHQCTGCGACAELCPCHRMENGCHEFDRKRCVACGRCVEVCQFDALTLYGKTMTPDEAAAAVLEDRAFYEVSGGGATVSGGEPLLRADFVADLFAALGRENIHTAVDTCGDVPWRAFEAVLPATDLFLYDFKHPDRDRHRAWTGRDNDRIRENLLRLGDTGKPVEIRMPLVPGCNLDADVLAEAGAFLATVGGVTGVRLLAYHALAGSKYKSLDLPQTLPDVPAPTDGDMERAAEGLRACGLRVLK